MEIPTKFQAYPCADYFTDGFAEKGYHHPTELYWFVEPVDKIEELYDEDNDEMLDFLSIGGPGVDGIRWGYRKGEKGIWSWNPISGDFAFLADTVAELLRGWDAGKIRV